LTSRVLSPLTRVLTYGTCVGLSKVLKGCVREVFKVMAQVDHDLTTINFVDPRLRVIKNMGRHNKNLGNPRGEKGVGSYACGS
jgi:hypothetical protein